MSNNVPLYRSSLLEAHRNGELDLWRESHRANIACKKAIEEAVRKNFDGMHLNTDTAKGVIVQFGYDRVNWVLANTIQHLNYDSRFSSCNKEWAKGFFIPKNAAHDNSLEYIINSHPAVLDGFINQARKEYDMLNLFDNRHCLKNSKNMDYENHVLVLRADVLKDEYKTPDDQLFYANHGGFGCSPTASGRKVMGEFLKDDENASFNRTDFIGIIDPQYLPEWVAEKIKKMTVDYEQEQNLSENNNRASIDSETIQINKPDNLLRVVMVEPGKAPYEMKIENTLNALQQAIGGLIEYTYPFDSDNAVIVSNEESKLMGMEGNRTVNGELYAGPFFIVGDDGKDGNCSLTDEQVAKYCDMFKDIEHYTTEDVQDSIDMTFMSF